MSEHASDEHGGTNGQYSNVIPEDLFRLLLHLEIQKAVRLQYCVSVICLAPDVPAQSASPTLPAQIAESAVRQLRGTDVATIFSAGGSVGLMLIDADTRTLGQILDRATDAARVAVSQAVSGQDQPLSLSAGASCYPEKATSGRDLLRQAADLLAQARAEGGNRLYLPT
jgi:GGDEF domain-containing protein